MNCKAYAGICRSLRAVTVTVHSSWQVSMADPDDPMYDVHAARHVMGFDVYYRHRHNVYQQCSGGAAARPLQVGVIGCTALALNCILRRMLRAFVT